MKYLLSSLILLLILSCKEPRKLSSTNTNNWEKRAISLSNIDSLESGTTFLSIYSQIYIKNDEDFYDLTATVSIHNPNLKEKIYIDKAVYFNTNGEPIRTYFDKTIFIKPMETVQIVIDGVDNKGGTGANFIFDWKINPKANNPIFEAVMVNPFGQHGISFVTNGKKINK